MTPDNRNFNELRDGVAIYRALSSIIIRLCLLAFAALATLNMLFELDLPGAVEIEHAAYSLVVMTFIILTEHDWTLPVVGSLLLSATVAGFLARKSHPKWHRFTSSIILTVVAGGQAGFIVFGMMMEKEIAIAALGGLAAFAAWTRHDEKLKKEISESLSLALKIIVGLCGAAALYYTYSILETDPSGYPILEWAGGLFAGSGSVRDSWTILFFLAVGLSTLAAIIFILPRSYIRNRLGRLAGSSLAAFAILLAYFAAGRDIRLASSVFVIAGSLASAEHLTHWGAPVGPTDFKVRDYPKSLIALSVLAGLCMFHAYAFRVLPCDPASRNAHLMRLGDAPEVFRAVLDEKGENLFLVLRTEQRIVRVNLRTGSRHPVDPGPLLDRDDPGSLRFDGVPEDLILIPGQNKLAATFCPYPDLAPASGVEPGGELTDIIVFIDPAKNAVDEVAWLKNICWINCIRWNDETKLLYVGCEDRRQMMIYDPASGEITQDKRIPYAGDIQDLEFDYQKEPPRIYTISLWYNSVLSELDEKFWTPINQLRIGGANYEMAFSRKHNLLFISRFYESRVLIVDAESLEKVGRLRTGFGARALAVDDSRGILLASSIYDGKLRVYDFVNDKLVAELNVGGHVKSIALSEGEGAAYFGSQCGLFRLDLAGLLTEAAP
jgi:hypothetical protein